MKGLRKKSQLWLVVHPGVSHPCVARGASPLSINVGLWDQGERPGNRQNGAVDIGGKEAFFWKSPADYGGKPFFGARGTDPPPCLPPHPSRLALTAASMDASPALCAPSTEWGAPWILMLLLTVGQGFTIVVLSVMLWRRRVQGTKHRSESLLPRGVAHILPLYPVFSRGGGG